jgi:hypothetical protein
VLTICCVPGRNELDVAAALLLAYVRRFEGGVARHRCFLPPCRFLVPFMRALLEQAGLVCLSLMRTSAPARARYLVRRILRRTPGAQVLVGLWGLPPAELAAATAAIGSSVHIVTHLRDAVAEVSALASGFANGADSLGGARPSQSERGVAAR